MHIPDGFLPAGLRLTGFPSVCLRPSAARLPSLSGHPYILSGLSGPLRRFPAAAVPAAHPAPLFLPGADQAFRAEADQIRPSGLCERFMHQIIIFRVSVLDQFSRTRLPLGDLPLSSRTVFPCQLSPFG